jgi:hypothetical protein
LQQALVPLLAQGKQEWPLPVVLAQEQVLEGQEPLAALRGWALMLLSPPLMLWGLLLVLVEVWVDWVQQLPLPVVRGLPQD